MALSARARRLEEAKKLREFCEHYAITGNATAAASEIGYASYARIKGARMLQRARQLGLISESPDQLPLVLEHAIQAYIAAQGNHPVAVEMSHIPPEKMTDYTRVKFRRPAVAREVAKYPLAMAAQQVLERLAEIAQGQSEEQKILRMMGTPGRIRDFVSFLEGAGQVAPETQPAGSEDGQPEAGTRVRAFAIDLDKAIKRDLDHLIKKIGHDAETGAPKIELADSVGAITALLQSRQKALETMIKIYGLEKSANPDQGLNNIRQVVIQVLQRGSDKDRRAFDSLSGRLLGASGRVLDVPSESVLPEPTEPPERE